MALSRSGHREDAQAHPPDGFPQSFGEIPVDETQKRFLFRNPKDF